MKINKVNSELKSSHKIKIRSDTFDQKSYDDRSMYFDQTPNRFKRVETLGTNQILKSYSALPNIEHTLSDAKSEL